MGDPAPKLLVETSREIILTEERLEGRSLRQKAYAQLLRFATSIREATPKSLESFDQETVDRKDRKAKSSIFWHLLFVFCDKKIDNVCKSATKPDL